ncbi:MAG: alpha/beta hydrolase [Deltaproteobacteria bacterium]|jgi:pimeloyl-ACP methyl ester carboxylesterase|nr:alpha/beta hydrolase [Deltaproteobacteria bacterium]
MMRTLIRRFCCAFFVVCILAGQTAAEPGVWREANYEGIKIAYLEAGRPDAQALVFIPGWSCDASFWRLQIPEFSKLYHVIAVDLPGFGKSGKPHDRAYTPEFFARSLHAVIQDAKITSPVLIGHSMGYSVCRQYMIIFPDAIRAVVNVDGAHFRIPETPEVRAAFGKNVRQLLSGLEGPDRKEAVRQFVESTFYGQTPKPLQKEIMAAMSSADHYAATSAVRELFRLDQWRATSFNVPCLALYALAENLPPTHEAYMRTVFPRLTYEIWANTGHYLMLEQPRRFNATLNKFLSSLSR